MLKFFFWSSFERFGSQLINLLVQIFLARILAPEIFGLIGLIQIFITLAQVIVEAGIGNYIIQTKDLYKDDISTSLVINIALAIIIYTVLFFTAPMISEFYNQKILIDILRLYSIAFILQSFYVTNQAIYQRDYNFKIIAYITISSTTISAIVSIIFVYFYKNVYILVIQQLVFHLVKAVLFTVYGRKNFVFNFTIKSFKSIYKYSSYLLIIGIINVVFEYSYLIIIGKFYNVKLTGLYYMSLTLVGLLMTNISLIIEKVSLPILSKLYHISIIKFKEKIFIFSNLSILLLTTISFIFIIYSYEILSLIYGEKWLEASFIFSCISVAFLTFPLSIISFTIFKINGSTNIFLYTNIVSKIFIAVSIYWTYNLSIEYLLIAQIVATFLSSIIFITYACRSTSITLVEFITNHLNIVLLILSYVIIQLSLDYLFNVYFIFEILFSILITFLLNKFIKIYNFKILMDEITVINYKNT